MGPPPALLALLLPTGIAALRAGEPLLAGGRPATPNGSPSARAVLSQGCFDGLPLQWAKAKYKGFDMHMNVPWSEPGLPAVNRSYGLFVPPGYQPNTPVPVVFVFHGWGEGAEYHRNYHFGKLATREKFVVVYPIGMDDCNTPDCQQYTSWNGAGTAESTPEKMTCDPEVQTLNTCYKSCRIKKGSCHVCDWSSCYDDIGYVRKVLGLVQQHLCLDRRRVFAHGCSNGAMFVYELARKLPGLFAGVVASCGGKPHLGWETELPANGPPISLATIVGNKDDVIPRNGTLKGHPVWDGYFYASERRVMEVYKDYNHCKNSQHRRYGAGLNAQGMVCFEEGYDCAGGASVARCVFDGIHDFNQGIGKNLVMDDVEFAWRFLSDHPLEVDYLSHV